MENTTLSGYDIKKQFWKSQGFQLLLIIALVVGSIVLPKIPALRGWEEKFTTTSVDFGRIDIPNNAIHIKTVEEAAKLLPGKYPHLVEYLRLRGPFPVAAWSCKPLGQPGLCVRYLWKENHPVMLVVTTVVQKTKKKVSPFTKSSWGGYFFTTFERDIAIAVSGPFEPEEILSTLSLPKY